MEAYLYKCMKITIFNSFTKLPHFLFKTIIQIIIIIIKISVKLSLKNKWIKTCRVQFEAWTDPFRKH